MEEKPYQLLLGDSLQLLKTLPSGSVNGLITDPPYSSGGLHSMARMQSTSTKYISGKSSFAAGKYDFYGDNRDQRSYTSWTTEWLTECHRVLKSGAPICIFTDWRQIPTITDAMQWSEYCWRGIFVWDKKNGRPHRGKFRQQCEFVVWGSKGDLYVDKNDPVYLKGLVSASSQNRQHQTEKPQGVMEELVKI